eukprot:1562794-Prorocentrum_lima.AAC.1
MVGTIKEHMRKVLHGSRVNEQYWPYAALCVCRCDATSCNTSLVDTTCIRRSCSNNKARSKEIPRQERT